jgi:toxin ParE1/3/4
MAEIRWSVTAGEDLQGIEEYIARDSPVHAVRVVDRIIETVEQLVAFPLSGRMVPEFEREDLRELIAGSYRIVYHYHQEKVYVLRVVHAARDIVQLAARQPWETIE